MQKLLTFIGITIGGYVGWFVGERVGIFTAFVLSIVGTGAGIYAARRVSQQLLP
jgi:hypothetical protein